LAGTSIFVAGRQKRFGRKTTVIKMGGSGTGMLFGETIRAGISTSHDIHEWI
jgi:hypothetical protein